MNMWPQSKQQILADKKSSFSQIWYFFQVIQRNNIWVHKVEWNMWSAVGSIEYSHDVEQK